MQNQWVLSLVRSRPVAAGIGGGAAVVCLAPPRLPEPDRPRSLWQRLHALVDWLERRGQERRALARDRALARTRRTGARIRFLPAGPVAPVVTGTRPDWDR